MIGQFDDLIPVKDKNNLTQEDFLMIFEYKEGSLFWKIKKYQAGKVGDKAGSLDTKGYWVVTLFRKRYKIHRIIFIMFNGMIGDDVFIDHKDTNPSNNLIDNLRVASKSQNQHNKGLTKGNTSGYKGVSFRKCDNRWVAIIMVNSKSIYLGLHHTPELAHEAYKLACIKYHGDFSNCG